MSDDKRKCFLLLPRPVFPTVSGYSLKNYNLIRILSEKYALTVGVISPSELSDAEKDYYKSLGIRFFSWRIPRWKSCLSTALGLFSHVPLQVCYYYDRGLQRRVDQEAAKADVLIAALIRTRRYFSKYDRNGGSRKAGAETAEAGRRKAGAETAEAGRRPGKRLVFDMVDSIAMNYARSEASTASLFWRLIYRIEGRRLAAYEKKWIRESDVTYLFNPEEQKALSGYGSVRCVPHGVNGALFTYEKDHAAELEEYRSAGGAEEAANGAPLKNAVVFMGKMNYQPNVDAALWYLKNVHPKVCDRVPFVIVGAYPTEEVRKAAAGLKNVTVTGFVKDPYLYVSAAMAAAAPMQSGGGIQNKVLESMALARVNLVSPLAAAALEGLENGCCAGERVMYICRTPEEYAKRLLDMAEKTAEKRRLGRGNETGHADETEHVDETGRALGFSEYENMGHAAWEYENVGRAAREYENIGRAAREYIRRHYTWEKYGEAYLKGIEGER